MFQDHLDLLCGIGFGQIYFGDGLCSKMHMSTLDRQRWPWHTFKTFSFDFHFELSFNLYLLRISILFLIPILFAFASLARCICQHWVVSHRWPWHTFQIFQKIFFPSWEKLEPNNADYKGSITDKEYVKSAQKLKEQLPKLTNTSNLRFDPLRDLFNGFTLPLSVFQYFIQTTLKGIVLEAILSHRTFTSYVNTIQMGEAHVKVLNA